ncbi:hypothetical protein [Kitasatospora sp. NPDC091207]|uniref:hypothetical protein n=1 Tax=Kitasatospora sp. NPDC091207 TaxID=3364083 RepID=UPI003827E1C9
MSPSTTRRATTVRSLAGTVLAAALLVPAATACSSSTDAGGTTAASTPAAQGTTAPVGPPPTTPGSPTAPGTAAPGTAAPGAPTGAQGTTAPTAPAASPSSPRSTAPATAPVTGTKGKSPVRTETLVDGSTAEIQDTGNQNYSAKIVNKGDVLATLETHNADAGLDANGMFVVLSVDGHVHSWMGGEHQGPGTFKLVGGWTAKVTKIGELRYRAQILGNENAVYDTLETNQQDVGAVANGSYIVLSAGGVISSHM